MGRKASKPRRIVHELPADEEEDEEDFQDNLLLPDSLCYSNVTAARDAFANGLMSIETEPEEGEIVADVTKHDANGFHYMEAGARKMAFNQLVKSPNTSGLDDSYATTGNSSPCSERSIFTPIIVTPDSSDTGSNATAQLQEEALDFSFSRAAASPTRSVDRVKDESVFGKLKFNLNNNQILTSSPSGDPSVKHSAFPSPFPTYSFVDGMSCLTPTAVTSQYQSAMNLTLAASARLNFASPPRTTLNSRPPTTSLTPPSFLPNPLPFVPSLLNERDLSQGQQSTVKSILSSYSAQAHSFKDAVKRKPKQTGDFVLDQMGGDELKKRRRRSPNETLTAEEIAEYMGASNVPTGREGGEVFRCKYCNEEIDDLVRYLQHTLTTHNAYICHQCGKSFTTKSSLLRHRPIHTGLRRFACSICLKSFYRKDKCKSHIKRHLPPNEQNIDQYQHIKPVPRHNEAASVLSPSPLSAMATPPRPLGLLTPLTSPMRSPPARSQPMVIQPTVPLIVEPPPTLFSTKQ